MPNILLLNAIKKQQYNHNDKSPDNVELLHIVNTSKQLFHTLIFDKKTYTVQ